jgi:PST family polysaccharide transporter
VSAPLTTDRIVPTPGVSLTAPDPLDASPDAGAPGNAAGAPAGDASTLDRSLVRGIAWTGGLKWIGQLLSWATTILVARLLLPGDYGLVGMANVYMSFAMLLSEFGIGAAVVTMRDLSEEQIAQINSVSVLFGGAAFLVSCLVAWPLGLFFRAPELPLVVVALSTTFLISGLRTTPGALLMRDMEFRQLAIIDIAQTFMMSAAMLTAAALGARYWTLVLGAPSRVR